MVNISITNPNLSNLDDFDVTQITQNDNDLVNGLTDGSKDISVKDITIGGKTKLSNGAIGANAITFSSDTDTGIYRIGANNLGVACGGAVGLDIKDSGVIVFNNRPVAKAYLQNDITNIFYSTNLSDGSGGGTTWVSSFTQSLISSSGGYFDLTEGVWLVNMVARITGDLNLGGGYFSWNFPAGGQFLLYGKYATAESSTQPYNINFTNIVYVPSLLAVNL